MKYMVCKPKNMKCIEESGSTGCVNITRINWLGITSKKKKETDLFKNSFAKKCFKQFDLFSECN